MSEPGATRRSKRYMTWESIEWTCPPSLDTIFSPAMAILEEISEFEAAELSRSTSLQSRQTDEGDDNEIAGNAVRESARSSDASASDEVLKRIPGLEHVPTQSPGEGESHSGIPYRQPDLQREIRADSSADVVVQQTNSKGKKPGAGEAVLLGALATGINGPTWFAIKAVLVALAASLVLLLHVAVKSSNVMVLLNVMFLIIIAGALALLLSWYVSEIGLVTVEKQMAELNLTDEPLEAKKTE